MFGLLKYITTNFRPGRPFEMELKSITRNFPAFFKIFTISLIFGPLSILVKSSGQRRHTMFGSIVNPFGQIKNFERACRVVALAGWKPNNVFQALTYESL